MELKRELNIRHVIALIPGSVIGSGVFINLPIVAREAGSPWLAVAVWLLMVIVAIASQLYLIYGTFIAFPLGGVLSAVILIGTGLPMYYYFKYRRSQKKLTEE